MNSEEGLRWVRQAVEGNLTPAIFLLERFILETKENSFAGSGWRNVHYELLREIRKQKLYIPDGGLSINPRSNLCRFIFSSP